MGVKFLGLCWMSVLVIVLARTIYKRRVVFIEEFVTNGQGRRLVVMILAHVSVNPKTF